MSRDFEGDLNPLTIIEENSQNNENPFDAMAGLGRVPRSKSIKKKGRRGSQSRDPKKKQNQMHEDNKANAYFSCLCSICKSQVTKGYKLIAKKT